MCIQVTNPLLLFPRLKINHQACGSYAMYAFILENGVVEN
jgi:hypothetical protein